MALPNLLTNSAERMLAHKGLLAASVRENEGKAAQMADCDLAVLMHRAGSAALHQLKALWPDAKRLIVVAGNGNNGGDAYVLACLAKQQGFHVTVVCIQRTRVLKGDGAQWQQKWGDLSGITQSVDESDFEAVDVIVDGLLGTGFVAPLRADIQQLIERINQSKVKVLSLDVPSGLQSDTGLAQPICVKADATVSFIAAKIGTLTGIGKHHAGQLLIEDLAVGEQIFSILSPVVQQVNWSMLQALPVRPIHGHKTTFGKLLCAGGSDGMAGAIRIAAEGALRAGSGMVKVYCASNSVLQVAMGRPELMLSVKQLADCIDWSSGILLGPGLGQSDWSVRTFELILKGLQQSAKPLVLDADGLNLLAANYKTYAEVMRNLPQVVLTPHSQEAARLLGIRVEQVEADRYQACRAITERYGAVCILKGAGTIVTAPYQPLQWVCQGGNPGMAVAGMGDLLAGVVAALMVQGVPPVYAAIYGVCAHAEAGDEIASQTGQRGILPTDLLMPIKTLLNKR